MKEKSNNFPVEPELEARIVAFVLREASPEEREQLSRLIAQRPELEAVKKQFEAVHELLRDCMIDEPMPDEDDWKLPTGKRSEVLSAIGSELSEPSVHRADEVKSLWLPTSLRSFTRFASAVCLLGFIGLLTWALTLPAVNARRESPFTLAQSLSTEIADEEADVIDTAEPLRRTRPALAIDERLAEPASKPSRLSIKDNLTIAPTQPSPYYLQDDVQYFSAGTDFKLPKEVAALAETREQERKTSEVSKRLGMDKEWFGEVRAAGRPSELHFDSVELGWRGEQLRDKSELKKSDAEPTVTRVGLDENDAQREAFSTFSLHVSDVSFKLAHAALSQGEWPDAAKIRIEEFVNALDYGDPMPSQDEKVACRVEQCIHPFLQQRNLLRVSMRTAAAGRAENTPLRLTLLLDNSGSMERIDRQQTVRRAFALLAGQLNPTDQVTLICFARQPRLLADKVSGSESRSLVELIENLPSEGGTNIEAALQLAFEKAQEQQLATAQNRIVLLTDGAVNLGDADPESLSQMVLRMRDAGIAFDAAGIGVDGLGDDVLEALTRQGDGRYYLLDSAAAADDGFADQIAGALRPSAMNVKVQVEFNPKRVGRYKLLGFEKHLLNQEDFRNDAVDAAEMAAAETGVAVYQFEAKPDGEGDVGSVSVRFADLSTGQMIENRWPILYEPSAPRVAQASRTLRLATSAALFAAKLKGDPLGETVNLKTLSELVGGLPDQDQSATRVQQLQQMIEQARQVSGE